MTAEKVKVSKPGVKMRGLQEKYRSTSVDVSVVLLTVVMLAGRSLDLDRTVMKQKQALVEVERKQKVASSAVLSAQHVDLAKKDEASKSRGNGRCGRAIRGRTGRRN